MRRYLTMMLLVFLVPVCLTGCEAIHNVTGLSAIYGVMVLMSVLLLVGYCMLVKKKTIWFLLLFSSIVVVNTGYLALSLSRNLEEALLANRLAYLGSVFLPLSMLMNILHITNARYRKWLPGSLLALSLVVFLLAATPGYLSIYYRSVRFVEIDGVGVLEKLYGPLHCVYLFYLVGYFSAMVGRILYARKKRQIDSTGYVVILVLAVFINLLVWLIEQFVRIDFEILSVSYIVSGLFLLGLHLFAAEQTNRQRHLLAQLSAVPAEPEKDTVPTPNEVTLAQLEIFRAGLTKLTPKEQAIYDCYVAGMPTAEIMDKLSIKENTLKFHNKNLYGKLGVASRKQLMKLHKSLPVK